MDIEDSPIGNWADLYKEYYSPYSAEPLAQEMKPHLLKRAKAAYYGQITFLDLQINRFLETLREFNLNENTIVVFSADHGDLMGDHNLFRKALPYEGCASIPMIINDGPNGSLKKGLRCDRVVELRDIMPTILEAAGLPIPEEIDGESFLKFTEGEDSSWREYIHGEHTFQKQGVHWITDGKTKYVWLSEKGTEQLFDLTKDPKELNDLVYSNQASDDDIAPWRNRLIEELTGREEGFTDGEKLIAGREVTPVLKVAL